jgi:hypothetical protein
MPVVFVRAWRTVGVGFGMAAVSLCPSLARADAGASDAAVDAAPTGVDASIVDASPLLPEAGLPKPPPIDESDAGETDAPTRFIDTGNDGACSVGGVGQAPGTCVTLAAVLCVIAAAKRRKR